MYWAGMRPDGIHVRWPVDTSQFWGWKIWKPVDLGDWVCLQYLDRSEVLRLVGITGLWVWFSFLSGDRCSLWPLRRDTASVASLMTTALAVSVALRPVLESADIEVSLDALTMLTPLFTRRCRDFEGGVHEDCSGDLYPHVGRSWCNILCGR